MKWTTSIDELVVLFRDAVRALIPIAERAHMPWKEPDAYDDWGDICETLYRSIVIRSIECADELDTFQPVLDYDRRVASYAKNSFFANAKAREKEAFVCFETKAEAFDVCLFAVLDANLNVVDSRRVATADVEFVFGRRDSDTGTLEFFDRITVLL